VALPTTAAAIADGESPTWFPELFPRETEPGSGGKPVSRLPELAAMIAENSAVRDCRISFVQNGFSVFRLSLAIKKTVKSPGIPVINGARPYWGAGVLQRRDGNFDQAIFNLTDAISLDPQNSLYWYTRALAFRDLDLIAESDADAKAGAYFEQRLVPQYGDISVVRLRINHELEKLGNRNRVWLDRIRTGDGEAWGRFP